MQIMSESVAITGGAQSVPQPRLVRAAHEFEAQMMKELLEPLAQSSGLTGDDSDAGSAGALGGFATESLAQAMSQQGGIGIADRLIQSMSQNGTAGHVVEVTGNQHEDTGIRSGK